MAAVEPHLRVRVPAGPPTAMVLVLHGGRSRGRGPVRPWSLAYLRMRPFTHALWRAGRRQGLVVASMRYVVQGWNDADRSPVPDARWALDRLRECFGDIDVGLVGHSMGGRTALAVADDPSVRCVVALAPWIEPGDSVEPVTGRTLLIAHGTADRITSPTASAAFAERARSIAKQVTYVAVEGERHAMLHRPRLWHQLAAGFTVEVLVNRPPDGTIEPKAANVIREAVTGTPSIRV